MSEFELSELAGAAMSNFLTSFTVFVSIVTAYVVAAFGAGVKLTKLQVSIVNVCFLIASGAIGLLSVLIFQVFLRRAQAIGALNDPNVGVVLIVDFTWVVAALYVILVCGSLAFMWNVRQPKSNK
jgi:hypothetical protein